MRDLSGDEGVFIRSMASRGSLGGIAQKTASLVQVFDAAGLRSSSSKRSAPDRAKWMWPGSRTPPSLWRRPVWAMKSRRSRPGFWRSRTCSSSTKPIAPVWKTRNVRCALRSSLLIPPNACFTITAGICRFPRRQWIHRFGYHPSPKPSQPKARALSKLAESIARHAAHLRQSGDWAARDRARLESEMETLLREALMDRFLENVHQETYEEMIERVVNRNISPYEAVKFLLNGK